jgi:hypothetical protein
MKKLLVTIVIGLFLAGVVWAGPPVAPSPCRWTSNGIECDGNRDGTPDLLINKSDGTVEISLSPKRRLSKSILRPAKHLT